MGDAAAGTLAGSAVHSQDAFKSAPEEPLAQPGGGVAGIRREIGAPNGEGAKLRGQGLRAEADAARGLPACESRDAGRVTP
jgi:hypothetical protein